jgi:hypothetical protein
VAQMAKEKKVDLLSQAKKITGIPVQEIIWAACKGKYKTMNEIDEVVYGYEQRGVIIPVVKKFALFLLQEWYKEHGEKK